MVRRSESGPRAEADGDKDPSNGSSAQTHEMEAHLVSSDATTESQDTDSSDELTEPVTAETSPSVSGSPDVRMGVSGNAIPVPEVEPEGPVEVNTRFYSRILLYFILFYSRVIYLISLMTELLECWFVHN